ncbi:hypothetical protein C923_05605 [Plasmodium falciparum UGT5.1]|uniref:Uncharacterized protein n=1 Tax=Plasmodium falciparum UGT5.1 TaxID=1237627 RepID=W7J468_PLAFA|nr:hypothetical protein C923_05605 [Plasmodium falciparum UGT5.1]
MNTIHSKSFFTTFFIIYNIFIYIYILKKKNYKWNNNNIMLDYVHHKRCSFLSNSWASFLKRLKS